MSPEDVRSIRDGLSVLTYIQPGRSAYTWISGIPVKGYKQVNSSNPVGDLTENQKVQV